MIVFIENIAYWTFFYIRPSVWPPINAFTLMACIGKSMLVHAACTIDRNMSEYPLLFILFIAESISL